MVASLKGLSAAEENKFKDQEEEVPELPVKVYSQVPILLKVGEASLIYSSGVSQNRTPQSGEVPFLTCWLLNSWRRNGPLG